MFRLSLCVLLINGFISFDPSLQAQHLGNAGVMSVDKPFTKIILDDQAFDLEGFMITFGEPVLGPTTITINGTVEIGRYVIFPDGDLDNPQADIQFIPVRDVEVSGTKEYGFGLHWFPGVLYTKQVVANPHWKVGKTYYCFPKPPANLYWLPGDFHVIPDPGDGDVDPTVAPPLGPGN